MNGIPSRFARSRTPPCSWLETTATISASKMPAFVADTRFSNPDPPPSLVPEAKTISLGFMLLHRLDGSAEFCETFVETLIAAAYGIHVGKRRLAFGGEPGR